MKQQLIIAQTFIRQDSEGRYCLNDCHRASGMSETKRPSNWIRTQLSKDLVNEIEVSSNMSAPLNIVTDGLNEDRGIYAVKELVYAYAMWISPVFQLQVIRAYDALVSQPQFQIPQTLPDALRLAADQAEEISILQPKADGYDLLTDANGSLCLTDAAKNLKIKRIDLINYLNRYGWIYKRRAEDNWIGYQDKIDQGLLWHKVDELPRTNGEIKIVTQVRITPKGLAKLATIFAGEAA